MQLLGLHVNFYSTFQFFFTKPVVSGRCCCGNQLLFRLSIHEYFLKICKVLKDRAACLKESVGSIIVDTKKNILSTGYNGTPMGTV